MERSRLNEVRFQYKGLFPAIDEASRISFVYRQRLDSVVSEVPCAACNGSRLRSDAAACRFAFGSDALTLGQLGDLELGETLKRFEALKPTKQQQQVAGELLREVRNRLKFLVDVGLDYLTLNRGAPTLSGGESQRIRLASQIGSGLTGVLYVLDEPTIGLHPRDNRRLLGALQRLRDLGNTMIVVEHDREVIAAADYLLDFGPGAGDRGGEITARGTPKQVLKAKASLTGQYLSGKKTIPVPSNRRLRGGADSTAGIPAGRNAGGTNHGAAGEPPFHLVRNAPAQLLTVRGARQHNLRNLNVAFPLGSFITVTGVSGSGKSSLINEVLYHTLARRLHRARTPAAALDDIIGIEQIDKVINVDQAPIGNSPLSNPATYTGVFDLVRQLFAQLPEAKVRGYQPRRFSFTKPGGRCEACEGNGQKVIEMHFLPDVWVECDVCHGQRYNPETLAVRYKGRSIADVLNMTVLEALEVFGNIPKIRRVLQTLADVGLDYLSLGQAAPTLSGGEAQRVKLAAELARPSTGRTLYILDEPTTGLHFDDVHKLLEVLNRLVDLGNTVIVVEHNLDVIKTADWIIDLGPEAGPGGGRIVVEGTPEEVIAAFAPLAPSRGEGLEVRGGKRIAARPLTPNPSPPSTGERGEERLVSHTALALAPILAAGPRVERPRFDPLAVEKPQQDDVSLEAVGRDAALPWQTDGRRWHTIERITTDGKACRWEGAILDWIDERVHEIGGFGATDWSERTVVEVPGVKKADGWFLHAMTSMEWLVRLVFRVAKNAFDGRELDRRLGIKPLNETPGLEVYSSEPRVWTTTHKKGPWQSVTLLVCRLEEIDTPAFRSFLKEAAASYQKAVTRLNTKPEDVMPWKLNGESWHLGVKGFPPGRRVRWDRALLPRLLELVRAVEPKLEVKWDARDAITLKVPGVSRGWAYLRTKDAEALVCRFVGKRGGLNLAQVEGIGVRPEIQDNRSDGDALVLSFEQLDQVPAAKLKAILAEHLADSVRPLGG